MTHERAHGGHGRGPWGARGRGRGRWAMEGGGGAWGPPSRRARRGDVRRLVLEVLAEGPAHGYDVIQRLEARSGGLWRPSPGSVYPLLQMLEDQGAVTAEAHDDKRVYQLTELGRQEVDQAKSSPHLPWEAEDEMGQQVISLRESVGQLHQAARLVARSGRPEQIRRSIEAVRDARKTIYEILAED